MWNGFFTAGDHEDIRSNVYVYIYTYVGRERAFLGGHNYTHSPEYSHSPVLW